MRRDFLVGIGLLAAVAVGTGSALAADIPVRPAPPAAAPATCCAIPDWVGFYIGGHGGGGGASTDFERQFFATGTTPFVPPSPSASGGLGGFQFGHNWQWGQVVGGLEADFSWADIRETSTFSILPTFPFDTFTVEHRIEELASARGRLGYLIWPSLLAYGTAGIGWGHSRLTTTDTFVRGGVSFFESATSFANEFGWVAGGGLEWKFWNNWLLRGEFLHYDFGRVTHNDLAFPFDNVNIRTTVDVGRAALSYKF